MAVKLETNVLGAPTPTLAGWKWGLYQELKNQKFIQKDTEFYLLETLDEDDDILAITKEQAGK